MCARRFWDRSSTCCCFRERAEGRQSRGVRKVDTRRYPYLIYYTVDDSHGEVVIVSIMHPAREREFPDA